VLHPSRRYVFFLLLRSVCRLYLTQAGNPRPRVFHLTTDSALINRYGFPSLGHGPLARRLAARSQNHSGKVLAVNLGKNKTSSQDDDGDYVAGIQAFADVADVLVINVSSPNTPGLR
jgi:dihydroorotate dehydrogenase